MRTLIFGGFAFALLLACNSASPTAVALKDTAPAAPAETSEACAELSEKGCLDSATCTLVPQAEAQRGYLCREARPPCETDFKQGTDRAEDCVAKSGCTFDPGRCYCAPDVVCICGGGPPPRCIPEGSADSGESAG